MKKKTPFKPLIWIGRIIGMVWSAWFLFFLLGEAVYAANSATIEGVSLALLFFICFSGIVISFFRIDIGGVVAGIGGIAFMVFGFFSAGHNRWIAVLVSGFPFFVASALLLLAWGLANKKKKRK